MKIVLTTGFIPKKGSRSSIKWGYYPPLGLGYIAAVLEREGYDVVTATNGKSCIAQAEKEKPDLILLDIVLPDINGLAICKTLKSNEATQAIRVVVCTNKLEAVDAAQARESKADEFIEKLSDSAILLETIRNLI